MGFTSGLKEFTDIQLPFIIRHNSKQGFIHFFYAVTDVVYHRFETREFRGERTFRNIEQQFGILFSFQNR